MKLPTSVVLFLLKVLLFTGQSASQIMNTPLVIFTTKLKSLGPTLAPPGTTSLVTALIPNTKIPVTTKRQPVPATLITTTTVTTVTTISPKYSVYLLFKKTKSEKIQNRDVEDFILHTTQKKTTADIKRKIPVGEDLALLVVVTGKDKELPRDFKTELLFNNKTVLNTTIWKAKTSLCSDDHCSNPDCQLNVGKEEYCTWCPQSNSSTNANKWVFKNVHCLENSESLSKKFLYLLFIIPLVVALILLAVLVWYCCKIRWNKNINHELEKIHPAIFNSKDENAYNEVVSSDEKRKKGEVGSFETMSDKKDTELEYEERSDTFRYSNGSDVTKNKGSVRGLY